MFFLDDVKRMALPQIFLIESQNIKETFAEYGTIVAR